MRIVYGGDIYIYIYISHSYISNQHQLNLYIAYIVSSPLSEDYWVIYLIPVIMCVRACVYNQGKIVMVIIGLANNTSIGIKYLLP